MATEEKSKFRLLVFAPFGKDAALISEVLLKSGVLAEAVKNPSELGRNAFETEPTQPLLPKKRWMTETTRFLGECIAAQPPWSDFPLIILTGGGASTPLYGNGGAIQSSIRQPLATRAAGSPGNPSQRGEDRSRARARQYEIRDHLEELKQTHLALQEANDRLESLVEQRTSVLRKLSAQLLRAQDDERRRMARELHDGLGQSLAAAQINLGLLSFQRRCRFGITW